MNPTLSMHALIFLTEKASNFLKDTLSKYRDTLPCVVAFRFHVFNHPYLPNGI